MASTYSPKLRFELIGAGEQAGLWGTTTNKNVGQLIEQAIAGVTTVELDGVSGNYTLTALDGAPDQSRSAVILCTYNAAPASGAINLIVPTQTKLYVVRNDCGQTVTVKTAAQTGGVALLNGEATLVFCDGTDAVLGLETAAAGVTPVNQGGTGQSSFTAGFIKSPGGSGNFTSSSTVNAASELANEVPVLNGGSGRASATAYSVICGGTSSTGPHQSVSGLGTAGFVLTSNGAGALPTWQAASSSGVSQITQGTGINVSTPTGNVTITNTGVTSVAQGSGITVSSATGNVTISSSVNPSDYVTVSGGSQSISSSKTFNGTASFTSTATFGSTTTLNGPIGVNSTMTINTGSGGGIVSSAYNFTSVNESIFGSSGLVSISVGGSARIDVTTSEFTPDGDNNMNLGSPSKRWIAVYALNGSIQTSDFNEKQDIADLDDAEKRVATRIKGLIKKFRFKEAYAKKGDGARIHVGVIAQEVRDAFTAEGLNADRYGIFCSDTWWEKEEQVLYPPTGETRTKTVVYKTPTAGAREVTRLGVRYDELLAFVIASI